MSLRSAIARIPGVRKLAERLGLVAPSVGYDDRPATPEIRRDLRRLWWANRLSRRSILQPGTPAVVTMTTHGIRLARVYLAIESIARGTRRPTRFILWLDDPKSRLPRPLRRLQRRGLEVKWVEKGLKVHTKYYPYVISKREHDLPLVTSDDDIVYPPTWLEDILAAAERNPLAINCYRAHHIEMDGDDIAPYLRWTPQRSSEPTFRAFGTSVSGQWFPPQLLDLLREEGLAFKTVAENNDDIWIHKVAVAAGIPTAQVTDTPQHFPFVPGTQVTGLYFFNAVSEGNDGQIRATYDAADRAALRDAR
ncbi:glycosyltransferase [Schumannella luteola]